MEEPIKIIWKYKNNNRRVQYAIYIFVGPVSNNIKQVLNKIEKLSFYNALVKLTEQENKILVNKYGEKWYNSFFNFYHINSTINTIKDTPAQKKEIIKIYGEKWYEAHIESHKLTERKLIYTYESLIKDENLRKTMKKGKVREYGSDDDIDLDYTTNISTKKQNLSGLFEIKKKPNMKGGMRSDKSSHSEDGQYHIFTLTITSHTLIYIHFGYICRFYLNTIKYNLRIY